MPKSKQKVKKGLVNTIEENNINVSVAAIYGSFTFAELNATGNLIEINNSETLNKQYLYFDKEYIKDFYKLTDIDQKKFITLCKPENIKTCAAENQQGIKKLNNKNIPKCRLPFDNHNDIVVPFSHELKIFSKSNRIGLVLLDILTNGTQIYLATHVIMDGIHNNKHNKKILFANNLSYLRKKVIHEQFSEQRHNSPSLKHLGLFRSISLQPILINQTLKNSRLNK